MNSHDFMMAIGAKSGLLLDAENGVLSGKSNGIKLNIVVSAGQLNMYLAVTKGMVHPTDSELAGLLSSISDVKSVRSVGKAFIVSTKRYSTSFNSVTNIVNTISSVTKAITDADYTDDSDNCLEDIEIKGKNVSALGGTDITGVVYSFFGCLIGAVIAIFIMWQLASISFLLPALVSTGLLLLLPIIGFELMHGQKSIAGLAVMLIILLITADVMVRISTASEALVEYNSVVGILSAFDMVDKDAVQSLTMSDVFWQLPSMFKGPVDFMTDIIFGLLEAITLFVLAVVSYFNGNKSVFDLILWLFASITGQNRK